MRTGSIGSSHFENLQARLGRAKISFARLSGSSRFSQGMERGWTARLENKWSGTETSAAGAEPSTLAAADVVRLSALVSTKCLGSGEAQVDGWRAAAEASFGIGESSAREFGWGHRQRAALVRHCVLTGYLCLPVGQVEQFCSQSAQSAKYLFDGFVYPLRLLLSIVRSLAHLPDFRQCPNRHFVATLP